jgi:hypothetical protein
VFYGGNGGGVPSFYGSKRRKTAPQKYYKFIIQNRQWEGIQTE